MRKKIKEVAKPKSEGFEEKCQRLGIGGCCLEAVKRYVE
jgi:hypothetical protein